MLPAAVAGQTSDDDHRHHALSVRGGLLPPFELLFDSVPAVEDPGRGRCDSLWQLCLKFFRPSVPPYPEYTLPLLLVSVENIAFTFV